MREDKHNEEEIIEDELTYDEPTPEDFLFEEEEKEESEKTKKRKKRWIKITVIAISFLLVFQAVALLVNMFSLDAIDFLKTSYRLSQNEEVQQWKEAVVTLQVEKQTGTSKGTGFFIADDGLIVTNHHVIADDRWIGVSLPDGKVYEAEVLATYEDIDLAFIQIEGEGYPYLPLSEQSGMLEEKIYVIGNPLFFTQIANEGFIVDEGGAHTPVSISAPIYKGNSGSPVINSNGEVVAVVYAKTVPQNGRKSVGLAIPIEFVWELHPE